VSEMNDSGKTALAKYIDGKRRRSRRLDMAPAKELLRCLPGFEPNEGLRPRILDNNDNNSAYQSKVGSDRQNTRSGPSWPLRLCRELWITAE
jgi:hypothetical protein